MTSTGPVLLLLSAGFFTATVAGEDCESYVNRYGIHKPSIDCGLMQFCCGTCDNRYCCYNPLERLSDSYCFIKSMRPMIVGVAVAGIFCSSVLFVVCFFWSRCWLYKMCRQPQPIINASTTVVSTQLLQQPIVQGTPYQYPPYQPVPPQSGFGGQPMLAPPPYQAAAAPGCPVTLQIGNV